MGLFSFFTQEIAMDLGTANTLIIHEDEIVVNEPSIIALNRNNPKEVLAVGKKALLMHEKTHESIRTVRPLKDGVIADPPACHFDPASLQCKGANQESCLTAAQVDTVNKIYNGPVNPRTGEPIRSAEDGAPGSLVARVVGRLRQLQACDDVAGTGFGID